MAESNFFLVTKLCLVMPADQALLDEKTKQSFGYRHYQAKLGSEKRSEA